VWASHPALALGDLQIVLFEHDHVPVAVYAVVAEALII
jgi:hypothetical protein